MRNNNVLLMLTLVLLSVFIVGLLATEARSAELYLSLEYTIPWQDESGYDNNKRTSYDHSRADNEHLMLPRAGVRHWFNSYVGVGASIIHGSNPHTGYDHGIDQVGVSLELRYGL
jgi:hypothetical protein